MFHFSLRRFPVAFNCHTAFICPSSLLLSESRQSVRPASMLWSEKDRCKRSSRVLVQHFTQLVFKSRLSPGFLFFLCSLTRCLDPAPLKLRPWRYINLFIVISHITYYLYAGKINNTIVHAVRIHELFRQNVLILPWITAYGIWRCPRSAVLRFWSIVCCRCYEIK